MEAMMKRADEINLKGILLVLSNGNITHLKKRDNMRLMHTLNLKVLEHLSKDLKQLFHDFGEDY